MDAWDCVREETGSSVTLYHIPDGTLHSFSLDGAVFQCHSDALGSVRMITDANGAVVARIEYGAWGEEIFVSAISALANFPYRFVGALGVRTDAAVGLVYMRNRWYSPELARFISRDTLMSANRYTYAANAPTDLVDTNGLEPSHPRPGQPDPLTPIHHTQEDGVNSYYQVLQPPPTQVVPSRVKIPPVSPFPVPRIPKYPIHFKPTGWDTWCPDRKKKIKLPEWHSPDGKPISSDPVIRFQQQHPILDMILLLSEAAAVAAAMAITAGVVLAGGMGTLAGGAPGVVIVGTGIVIVGGLFAGAYAIHITRQYMESAQPSPQPTLDPSQFPRPGRL